MKTLETKRIAYSGGFKNVLRETAQFWVAVYPEKNIYLEYLTLTTQGLLTIKKGFPWDGASGPGIDTVNFIRGSLVHDALYWLMREGGLPEKWRMAADKELRRICLEDGMWKVRAWWVYVGVRRFARKASLPESVKPMLYAP